MKTMSAGHPGRSAFRRRTIGVINNRQLYEGSSISRSEQTLLRGVRAAAHAHGVNLLLACGVGPATPVFEARPAWPVSLPDTTFVPVGPWNTDGLLAIPPFSAGQLDMIRRLLPPGFPLVFTHPQEGYPSVGPANDLGIAAAFAHLLEHGHRRIAFITTDAHPVGDAAERLVAYQAALASAGLPFDDALVGYGGHNVQQSQRALQQMLATGVDFTAVLASNDESAIGVLQALAAAGLQVPRDIAVVGFDDVLHARIQEPPLTTVRHPTFELGYQALDLLLAVIAGEPAEPTTLRVPTRLIVRESCGCLPYTTSELWRQPASADARAESFSLPALLSAMEEAVIVGARWREHTSPGSWCWRLVQNLLASLHDGDTAPWVAVIDELLQEVEVASEDQYTWQMALSVLHAQLEPLLAAHAPQGSRQRAEQLLDQAAVRISEHLQRQNTRMIVRQAERMDRMGAMTMQLLTALDVPQILAILAEHMPRIGIRHVHMAMFEAEGDDPVAWSRLFRCSPSSPPPNQRVPTRQFPPLGLYPDSEPFQVALLPLIVEEAALGFVAFDASFLEPCGLIMRQIAAVLRNSQLHAAAEEGRRQAEEASRMKSRFLSTVSHELRTPLNLIVGLSEILLHHPSAEQPGLADSTRQDLEHIFFNGQHLGRLIGDVLDLASSEAGQLRLYQEPLDLAEVLKVVAATGVQLAREKGLAWRAELPPSGPWVRGDRTRLRQVVLNLISNAIKFTDSGAVTLAVSVDQQAVTVSVSDTGPGVPLADQERIFDEFHTSERTATRAYGGLGLGLTICKQLIERQNGTIGLCSSGEPDAGTTFFFTLPLLAPSTTLLVPQGMRSSQQGGDRTVLVVDDDLETLALHVRIIRQHLPGCHVLQARGGHEALALLDQQRPSLVLLDLMMPELDGFGVLEAMRARPETADVPVVVLSSRTLSEADVERLNSGVAAILSKHLFSAGEIISHLEAALVSQRRLSPSMRQLVRRALAFIHAHYTKPITRDELALHLNVSPDYLTASFREEMGLTPIVYLNRYRISQARMLFETTTRSVTEIALTVGFNDLAYFSRMFHREIGMTANAYRRAMQR